LFVTLWPTRAQYSHLSCLSSSTSSRLLQQSLPKRHTHHCSSFGAARHTHACAHKGMGAHMCTHTRVRTYAQIHTLALSHIHTQTRANIHRRTHTHTHIRTSTYTHLHTHPLTHEYVPHTRCTDSADGLRHLFSVLATLPLFCLVEPQCSLPELAGWCQTSRRRLCVASSPCLAGNGKPTSWKKGQSLPWSARSQPQS